MGNKQKKKPIGINKTVVAEEEREKIRNSILKVFRERLSSTNGGGALLVNKECNFSESTSTSKNSDGKSKVCPKNTKAFNVSDSSSTYSMSDTDESPWKSSRKQTKHKRRKRTQANKDKKTDVHVHCKEKSDVAKHLKAAHKNGHTSRPADTCGRLQPVQQISFITQSRLTKRLGLFNKGKKSETIAREILIPESLKKTTKDDLIKILHNSDDDQVRPVPVLSPLYSPQQEKVSFKKAYECRSKDTGTVERKESDGSSRCLTITPVSPIRLSPPRSACSASATGSTSENLPQDLGFQNPPFEEIAMELRAVLKPRFFFKGRSYLFENKEELKRIMRQNVLRCVTPTSDLTKHTPTLSVKRSLADSYPPKLSSSSDGASSGRVENKTHRKPSYSLGSKSDLSGFHYVKKDIPYEKSKPVNSSAHGKPTDAITDANILLWCNDLMISDSAQATGIKNVTVDDMDKYSSDAKQMLLKNDTEQAKKSVRSRAEVSYPTVNSGNSNPSSQSSGYQGSQTLGHCNGYHQPFKQNHGNVLNSNQAVVTEFCKYPECIPQMKVDTYYGHSLHHLSNHQVDHWINSQNSKVDFLDLLDSNGLKDVHLSQIDDPETSLNVLKSATPDSDGSPLWLIPEVPILPRKPSFDVPSPPYKLYPRRLY